MSKVHNTVRGSWKCLNSLKSEGNNEFHVKENVLIYNNDRSPPFSSTPSTLAPCGEHILIFRPGWDIRDHLIQLSVATDKETEAQRGCHLPRTTELVRGRNGSGTQVLRVLLHEQSSTSDGVPLVFLNFNSKFASAPKDSKDSQENGKKETEKMEPRSPPTSRLPRATLSAQTLPRALL